MSNFVPVVAALIEVGAGDINILMRKHSAGCDDPECPVLDGYEFPGGRLKKAKNLKKPCSGK